MLSVWEERKVRLYGEHANVHQSHSQNDSGDLRGVAGGDGELGCLCGKAGTSHLCDGSAHSSGCVVNGWLHFELLSACMCMCVCVCVCVCLVQGFTCVPGYYPVQETCSEVTFSFWDSLLVSGEGGGERGGG